MGRCTTVTVIVILARALVFGLIVGSQFLFQHEGQEGLINRETKISSDEVKMKPHEDLYPSILHSSEYEEPASLPYPINTAGEEVSPFITPNGHAFYFFFTSDVDVP